MVSIDTRAVDAHDAPPLSGSTSPVRRRSLRSRLHPVRVFAVLALPAVLLYALGILTPLVLAARYSLSDINLLNGVGDFVGLANYVSVLTNPEFWSAFVFVIFITLGAVVIANAAGVTLALILNRSRRSFHVLRSITFIPSVLAGVVVAYIWSTILTDRGVLNVILGNLGLNALQISWLGSPLGAQISVIFVTVWPSIGFGTIIYLAGLQSIPHELLEAAAVDGSGRWRTFWAITWPLLRPALFVTTTMMVIGGFKAYDISVVLTGGGPAGATDTPAFQILRKGFIENNSGYANALAIILLLTLVIISIVGIAVNNRGDKS